MPFFIVLSLLYVTLQVIAAIFRTGSRRLLALIPLVWTLPVGVLTAVGFHQNQNLAPCAAIPTGGLAFVWLLLAMIDQQHENRRYPPPPRKEPRGFEVKPVTPPPTPSPLYSGERAGERGPENKDGG